MDMKQTPGDRFDDLLREHQMTAVSVRNQHALTAVKPGGFTGAKVTLYLFVDAAYRQNLAMLVDRPGHGNPLPQGQAGQGRQQDIELRARGRVSFHAAIFLFERNGCIQCQRCNVGKQC